MSQSSYFTHDIIVSFPDHLVDDLVAHGIDVLIQAWSSIPPIPPSTKHIWIYEQLSTKAIVYILHLDHSYHPTHLYQLTNPITLEFMEEQYDYHLNQIPSPIPKIQKTDLVITRISF